MTETQAMSLRERVAREMKDAAVVWLYENPDLGPENIPYEFLADAALSIALEEAATEIERKCRALPKSDRLRAYDFAMVVRNMKEKQ